MSVFMLPTPIVQSIGVVSIALPEGESAAPAGRKPVAAAVLTLRQRDDGHIDLFGETMTAIDETQFPLTWLIEQELVAQVPTLVAPDDLALLATNAALGRFFVEPKIAGLLGVGNAVDVTTLVAPASAASPGEVELCRLLRVPRLAWSAEAAERVWTSYAMPDRAGLLCGWAMAAAVSRLMLWSNLKAMREAEPGWFYEPMLGLRAWFDERESNMPELARWATSKPVMRAVSFQTDYRADLALRQAGQPGNFPRFEPGLFYT